ncbi:hypothetical protein [Pradoshia sp.]
MKRIKGIANQTSFILTVICLLGFLSLNIFTPPVDPLLFLMVSALGSLIIGVAGIPFEESNKKSHVLKSTFSIIVSLFLVILLALIYITPALFPFGIPNLYP